MRQPTTLGPRPCATVDTLTPHAAANASWPSSTTRAPPKVPNRVPPSACTAGIDCSFLCLHRNMLEKHPPLGSGQPGGHSGHASGRPALPTPPSDGSTPRAVSGGHHRRQRLLGQHWYHSSHSSHSSHSEGTRPNATVGIASSRVRHASVPIPAVVAIALVSLGRRQRAGRTSSPFQRQIRDRRVLSFRYAEVKLVTSTPNRASNSRGLASNIFDSACSLRGSSRVSDNCRSRSITGDVDPHSSRDFIGPEP